MVMSFFEVFLTFKVSPGNASGDVSLPRGLPGIITQDTADQPGRKKPI